METFHGNDPGIISLNHLNWEHDLIREHKEGLEKDRPYFNKFNRTLMFGVIVSLGAHAFLLLLPRTSSEPLVTSMAPAIATTLSIHLVRAPKITNDVSASSLQPASEPVLEPERNKILIKDKAKKSTSAIINERRPIDFSTESIRSTIQDQAAFDNQSASDIGIPEHTHNGEIFDPRLREKLLRNHDNARKKESQSMRVTTNVYGTMVELKNGPCFIPKESTASNEGVNWYHVKCNKGNTEEDQIMRNLNNTKFIK